MTKKENIQLFYGYKHGATLSTRFTNTIHDSGVDVEATATLIIGLAMKYGANMLDVMDALEDTLVNMAKDKSIRMNTPEEIWEDFLETEDVSEESFNSDDDTMPVKEIFTSFYNKDIDEFATCPGDDFNEKDSGFNISALTCAIIDISIMMGMDPESVSNYINQYIHDFNEKTSKESREFIHGRNC